MHTLILEPHDVLFFRDGRPMGGASSGHGAAWPMPHILNFALHAALHRAEFDPAQLHAHRSGRSGIYQSNAEKRERLFGSLVSAGPYPVEGVEDWYFPRPTDADDHGNIIIQPLLSDTGSNSLPASWLHGVGSRVPPTKEKPKAWWNAAAYQAYLHAQPEATAKRKDDHEFSDVEHTYGIGIDPSTGTTEKGRFYSAQYLRLHQGWRLGLLARAEDKQFSHTAHGADLLRALFDGDGSTIIAGGQQRTCSAHLRESKEIPLPRGMTHGFPTFDGKVLVKWIHLSPAIWPAMSEEQSARGTPRHYHPGGWLPNWIDPASGRVLLRSVSPEERRRRRGLHAQGKGYASEENALAIDAHLVSALVGKAIPVTGFALPSTTEETRKNGGAKSLHLAVPAGSIYYFMADNESEAAKLAAALNWHGDSQGHTILRRRSTLYGEKGYGLGFCGPWLPFHS